MSATSRICLDNLCGLCYANVRGRGNYRGHRGYREPRRVLPPQGVFMVRRRDPAANGSAGAGPDPFDAVGANHPTLISFLIDAKYDDGSPRQTGTLTISFDLGTFRGRLNDREAGEIAFVSSDGLAGLLEAAEVGLRDDRLDWRRDQWAKGQKKRKGG